MAAPKSQGFGTTLIQRALNSSGGHATISYPRNGLRCEIYLPL
jgi:two-component sensor histidine kinase